MSRTIASRPDAAAPTQREIESALQRVLDSRSFRRSSRHRRFLQYLVRSSVSGQVGELRESVVGVAVFDRSADTFDPRKDPVVRVEAGRLREKLSRYYREEGVDETLVIEVPVGGYATRFMARFVTRFAQRGASADSSGRDASGKARPAIAVMPLDPLGVNPDDEMLCVGLANQLIDTLSRVPGQRVASRHSVIKARAANMAAAELARTFGVAYVLSGSLQRHGDKLRCIVNLCRARDERHVWSQRFERVDTDPASLFDFQDTIAIAATVAVGRLGGAGSGDGPSTTPFPSGTSNVEARDLFEQARYLAHKRTFASCEKAIGYLERAIRLDPQFARAHGELGLVNFSLAGLRSEAPASNVSAARRAATRALELDAKDGEALSLLASITCRIDRNWSVAEPMFVEALRLNDHASATHIAYATCLAYNGRFDEALEHAAIARRGDPLNLGLRAVAASVACFASRYERAIREQREVLSLEPDHLFALVNLAIASMTVGDLDAAEHALDHACALAPDQPGPAFNRLACLGLRGRTDEAIDRLESALRRLVERPYSRFALATAQGATGQTDEMYRSLDHAARTRDLLYASLPVYPLFRTRHGEARFLDQLRQTGLRAVPHGTSSRDGP